MNLSAKKLARTRSKMNSSSRWTRSVINVVSRLGLHLAIAVLTSIEKKKEKPGTHAEGIAADIYATDGHHRFLIVKNALELGFSGIGIAKTFIHVDIRTTVPVIWSY